MTLMTLAIFDTKAAVYHNPFHCHNLKDGMRIFHRMLSSMEVYKGYEEDYVLMQLGTWDDKSGVLTSNGAPTHVISAVDVLGIDKESLEKHV